VTTIPHTPEDAEALLVYYAVLQEERPLEDAELRRLAGFLGANSKAWTLKNRQELHCLLMLAGKDAVRPIVERVADHPRTDIVDAAIFVLQDIAMNARAQEGD
jgi:hypothetical protein